MYQLLKQHRIGPLLMNEGAPALLAFAVAETFYRWHSFTLECAGFLATWYGISWAWTRIVGPRRILAAAKLDATHGR